MDGEKTISAEDGSFRSLIFLSGQGTLTVGDSVITAEKGDSIFVPAQNTDYKISGKCEIILSYV